MLARCAPVGGIRPEGGPQNYKAQSPEEDPLKYEDFGNFNFGATGAAQGYPDQELQRAAGAVQDPEARKPEFGSPLGGYLYGDDPKDQEEIYYWHPVLQERVWRLLIPMTWVLKPSRAWLVFATLLPIHVVLLAGCAGALCASENVGEAYSPGGGYKVVTMVRDCGATSPYVTIVSIVPEGVESPGREDYVFSATTDHGAAPAGPGGGPRVSSEWVSDEKLIITYDPQASTFRQETSYGDVSIEYEKVEDPDS